uniref:Uncharacterized protein n=1 Tax=Manihot esculenta TaxID=3983 RepID=A0A2C9V8F6_MANES
MQSHAWPEHTRHIVLPFQFIVLIVVTEPVFRYQFTA